MCELNAYEDWKSLFTDEAKDIWQQEPRDLRRVAMLLHIIHQEFKRIENDLQSNMSKYKEKSEVIKDKSKSQNENEVVLLQESPKIRKRRRLKHSLNSPSLLHKTIKKSIASESENKIKSFVLDSSCSESEDSNIVQLKPKNLFKSSKWSNKSDDDNNVLVDCSLIVDKTPPNNSLASVLNTTKEKDSKWFQTKNKTKQPKITKMLLSGRKKWKSDVQLKTHESVDPDKTFCGPLEKENRNSAPIPMNFKDYDIIPSVKYNSAQHVHKTEVVRKKSERLKLPGWSCTDCEKFYASLDLSPTQLKQKMDACSKHRNKFPPISETPPGFWDITMPPTQDAPIV